MKIKKILKRLLHLHPREIDLSLDRIKRLNRELGNPQDKLKIISITGTNGKYSIAQTIRSILEEAGYACDLYTSPHIQKINERFIFSGEEISDDDLCDLFEEVEKKNNNQIKSKELSPERVGKITETILTQLKHSAYILDDLKFMIDDYNSNYTDVIQLLLENNTIAYNDKNELFIVNVE